MQLILLYDDFERTLDNITRSMDAFYIFIFLIAIIIAVIGGLCRSKKNNN